MKLHGKATINPLINVSSRAAVNHFIPKHYQDQVVRVFTKSRSYSSIDGGEAFLILRNTAYSPFPLEDDQLLAELGLHARYGGPGQLFHHNPIVSRRKRYIVISQTFGYDI